MTPSLATRRGADAGSGGNDDGSDGSDGSDDSDASSFRLSLSSPAFGALPTPTPRSSLSATPAGECATPAASVGASCSSIASRTPSSTLSQGGSGRQDPATVLRICELGLAGASVVEIDRTLHREGRQTSTGTRWPAKNDGRVVVRMLLNHGITPVAGDAKIAKYAREYAAQLERKAATAAAATR